LVLGVKSNNHKNPYTLNIIEKYWTKWLQEMDVERVKVKNADIASSVEKVIYDFIQGK
jgi:hypothetical protein